MISLFPTALRRPSGFPSALRSATRIAQSPPAPSDSCKTCISTRKRREKPKKNENKKKQQQQRRTKGTKPHYAELLETKGRRDETKKKKNGNKKKKYVHRRIVRTREKVGIFIFPCLPFFVFHSARTDFAQNADSLCTAVTSPIRRRRRRRRRRF